MQTEKSIQELLNDASMNLSRKVCLPLIHHKEIDEFILAGNLNSASYYYVVDFRNKQNLILTQTEIQKAFKESKGSGFSALGIDTLICDGISNMALKILNEAGIEVYKPSGGNILHNLELMLSKKLNSQKAMSIPSSQTCSTSCSTCSTACT